MFIINIHQTASNGRPKVKEAAKIEARTIEDAIEIIQNFILRDFGSIGRINIEKQAD